MIQRKQSLWLLIAALLNSGVFFMDLYRTHTSVHSSVLGIDTVTDKTGQLGVSEHFGTLLLAIIMVLLPIVTIFLFKQRKRQLTLSFITIISVIGFIAATLFYINNITPVPASGNYWIGSVLPVISLVFLIMAIMGIRRDDKLVKSVDRLR